MEIKKNRLKIISNEKDAKRLEMFLSFIRNPYVQPEEVLKFIEHKRAQGRKNNYLIELKRVIKKSIFQFLEFNNASNDEFYRWERFFKTIKIKKSPSPVTSDLLVSKSEMLQILENCTNKLNYLIILTLYLTGLRNSELTNLKLTDISTHQRKDKNGNTIFYDLYRIFGKNQKYRVVPVDIRLRQEIVQCLKPRKYLFENPYQQPYSSRSIQRIVRKESESALGRNVWPHLLRHSHGTEFYELTKDIKSGSLHMGHNESVHMGFYVHPGNIEEKVLGIFNLDFLKEIG